MGAFGFIVRQALFFVLHMLTYLSSLPFCEVGTIVSSISEMR